MRETKTFSIFLFALFGAILTTVCNDVHVLKYNFFLKHSQFYIFAMHYTMICPKSLYHMLS